MFPPRYAPNGSSAPRTASAASVVAAPSGPTAHPGGMGSPARAASRTLTYAVSDVAWSTTNADRPGRVLRRPAGSYEDRAPRAAECH
jgi:hypothetical protein